MHAYIYSKYEMHTHKHRAAGESEICKASGQAEHLGRVNASLECKGWKLRHGFYIAVWRLILFLGTVFVHKAFN